MKINNKSIFNLLIFIFLKFYLFKELFMKKEIFNQDNKIEHIVKILKISINSYQKKKRFVNWMEFCLFQVK